MSTFKLLFKKQQPTDSQAGSLSLFIGLQGLKPASLANVYLVAGARIAECTKLVHARFKLNFQIQSRGTPGRFRFLALQNEQKSSKSAKIPYR